MDNKTLAVMEEEQMGNHNITAAIATGLPKPWAPLLDWRLKLLHRLSYRRQVTSVSVNDQPSFAGD